MSTWTDLPDLPDRPHRGDRRSSRWPSRLAPLALALALAVVGLTGLAIVVAVVGIVVGALALLSPRAGELVERALSSVGRWAGRAMSTVLLGLVAILVLAPIAGIAWVLRRDGLHARTLHAGTQWSGHAPRWATRRTFAPEPPRSPPSALARALGKVPRVIGIVVAVALLNYALGWLWDEVIGSHEDASATEASALEELRTSDALEDAAWSDRFWQEFAALDHEFVPFLLTRVADVTGEVISSQDGIRRSYEPTSPGGQVVWFFGGAAVWGEGQRDLHTIPSEVARLAEAAGAPVQVINFGQPGYTSWQSALLLEQELAVRPPPDLVVFYDGADDVAVQLEDPSDAPTHYNREGVEVVLTGRDSAAEEARDLWEDYRETSVLTRVASRLAGVFAVQPAGAADDALVHRATALHVRSVALAEHVAERAGVDASFFWQASSGVSGDEGAYRQIASSGGAVDLSRALDDADEAVFLDGTLTNEAGARMAAEAIWARISTEFG